MPRDGSACTCRDLRTGAGRDHAGRRGSTALMASGVVLFSSSRPHQVDQLVCGGTPNAAGLPQLGRFTFRMTVSACGANSHKVWSSTT